MSAPDPPRPRITSQLGPYTTLLLALIALVLLTPIVPWSARGGWMPDLAVTAVLLAGLLSVSRKKSMLYFISIMVVPALLYRWIFGDDAAPQTIVIQNLLSAFVMLLVVVIVTQSVFTQPGPVTLDQIVGGVNVYLLLGILFAQIHVAIEVAHPGAYMLGDVAIASLPPTSGEGLDETLSYFSFTTLTTLGYGDIRPAIRLSRVACMLEAVTGQLFVAIMIARLVSAHASHKD